MSKHNKNPNNVIKYTQFWEINGKPPIYIHTDVPTYVPTLQIYTPQIVGEARE